MLAIFFSGMDPSFGSSAHLLDNAVCFWVEGICLEQYQYGRHQTISGRYPVL